jgi:hypothetical protein
LELRLMGARLKLIAVVVASGLLGLATAVTVNAHPVDHDATPYTCDGKRLAFHQHRAKAILEHAYRVTYYSTHEVASRKQVEAFQAHKRCIYDPHRVEKLAASRKEQAAFQRARIAATPYAGGGYYWPIPFYVASCESGGGGMPNYTVGFAGAFGVLVATWLQWGGAQYAPTAGTAPPWAQDLVAHEVWTDVGPSGWECA